ncbi:hypothetical protein CPB85DRAFT_1549008 [Mucidula mucida]|nr:hypothetical protein CPB85DRAFT_1549008 [Mucidula mucida]
MTSFPDVYESPSVSTSSGLFNLLLDEDLKLDDPQPVSAGTYDFFGTFSNGAAAMDTEPQPSMGIDPQLVGTPSSHASPAVNEEEEEVVEQQQEKPQEKLTLTIAPIKVAGHGKARKGTVQSGGIVKKTAAPPPPPPAPVQIMTAPSPPQEKDVDNDDDLPADWRPPPEVFAKMTSKEKRQLRNKISARNFRVRRKEYISTLELDIAERDRLLQAIRSELGSTQSENQALRQEIAALKKALLEGRPASELTVDDIPVLNLPPPGPLPTAARPTSPSSLLTANTQKDVGSSSTSGFWGGVRMGGGGITPVHTVLMPDFAWGKGALQENINPALNAESRVKTPIFDKLGFDGFSDTNPFTVKNIDSYRYQLWAKMGHQQAPYPPSPPASASSSPHPDPRFSPSPFTKPISPYSGSPFGYSPSLSGLASSLGPKFFQKSSPSSILSGKYLPSPPSSPVFRAHSPPPLQTEQQQLMVAALASQTLLQKLGGAFWDAFSGSSSSSSNTTMDVDKVRRVLEGKAVVQIVDVEERKDMGAMKRKSPVTSEPKETCAMTALLEEGMKSLTLTKK